MTAHNQRKLRKWLFIDEATNESVNLTQANLDFLEHYLAETLTPTYLARKQAEHLLSTLKGQLRFILNYHLITLLWSYHPLRKSVGETGENLGHIIPKIETYLKSRLRSNNEQYLSVLYELTDYIRAHLYQAPIEISIAVNNPNTSLKFSSSGSIMYCDRQIQRKITLNDLLELDLANLPPYIQSELIEQIVTSSQLAPDQIMNIWSNYKLTNISFSYTECYRYKLRRNCCECIATLPNENFFQWVSTEKPENIKRVFPYLKDERQQACILRIKQTSSAQLKINRHLSPGVILALGANLLSSNCSNKQIVEALEILCASSANENSINAIAILLQAHKNPIARKDYRTALCNAIIHNNIKAVGLLYEIPDISNIRSLRYLAEDRTPEYLAVYANNLAILKIILNNTATDLYTFSECCNSELLLAACRATTTDCLQYLLDQPSTKFIRYNFEMKFFRCLTHVRNTEAIKLIFNHPITSELSSHLGSHIEQYFKIRQPWDEKLYEHVVARLYNRKRPSSSLFDLFVSLNLTQLEDLSLSNKALCLRETIRTGRYQLLLKLLSNETANKTLQKIFAKFKTELYQAIFDKGSDIQNIIEHLIMHGFEPTDDSCSLLITYLFRAELNTDIVIYLLSHYQTDRQKQWLLNARSSFGFSLMHIATCYCSLEVMKALHEAHHDLMNAKIDVPAPEANKELLAREYKANNACIDDTPLLLCVKALHMNIEKLEFILKNTSVNMLIHKTQNQKSDTAKGAFEIVVRSKACHVAHTFYQHLSTLSKSGNDAQKAQQIIDEMQHIVSSFRWYPFKNSMKRALGMLPFSTTVTSIKKGNPQFIQASDDEERL